MGLVESLERRVLFVEDDDVVRDSYAELLTDEGFTVDAVPDRLAALAYVREQAPSLALIDISLGAEREGGFQLCAELRARYPKLPIVFLTSHDSELDMVSGMRLGADDYIVKDSDRLNYLVARLLALLRRVEAFSQVEDRHEDDAAQIVRQGELQLDRHALVAYWKGEQLPLTLTQLWILDDLASHPGRARTRRDLMAAAQITVETNTMAAHIKRIREVFHHLDPEFDCIRTERSRGYRWLDPSD